MGEIVCPINQACEPWLLGGWLGLGVLAAEALDTACRVNEALLAGEERVAR